MSEYPDNGPPGTRTAADLKQTIELLEGLAAAVSGDTTLKPAVGRWWSWRLQRAADYLGQQLISEMSTQVSARRA